MVSHPAPKRFVLTLSWWSAPLKHEWSEGGLHVSGKEDGISKREAHQRLIQHFPEHQRAELDEFTKIYRGRGETADTGGSTPRTEALTAKGMFGKCIYTLLFAADCLTSNPPPQTTVSIMPGTQVRVCQPHLRSPQGSWAHHRAKPAVCHIWQPDSPGTEMTLMDVPRAGNSSVTALLEQAWHWGHCHTPGRDTSTQETQGAQKLSYCFHSEQDCPDTWYWVVPPWDDFLHE